MGLHGFNFFPQLVNLLFHPRGLVFTFPGSSHQNGNLEGTHSLMCRGSKIFSHVLMFGETPSPIATAERLPESRSDSGR